MVIAMKTQVSRDRWYILLLVLHGFVVMHLFMMTPTLLKYPQVMKMPHWEIDGVTAGSVSTAWLVNGYLLFGKAGLCILGCWTAMRCAQKDRFQPLLPLLVAAAVASYFFRRQSWEVIPQFLTPALMVIVMSLALTKPYEGIQPATRAQQLLWGIAQDRMYLVTLAFWGLVPLAVSHVAFPDEGLGYWPYYAPVLILALSMISLLRKPKTPLTSGGWLGIAVIFALSLVLCSFGGMADMRWIHYGVLCICYLPMVIVECRRK